MKKLSLSGLVCLSCKNFVSKDDYDAKSLNYFVLVRWMGEVYSRCFD
jgi:hypothetical protein